MFQEAMFGVLRASSIFKNCQKCQRFKAKGIEVGVYEPSLDETHFFNSEVTHELNGFKSRCDVIIANCMVVERNDVRDKVFTRDLFGND